jgi:ribosome-associated heat shock protein Hsp15
MPEELETPPMRLDQWLWAVRLYKSRTLAADAIRAGHVKVNGLAPKPARSAQPGDTVTVQTGSLERTFRVVASPTSRVGAKLVCNYAHDLTPLEVYQQLKKPEYRPPGVRAPGSGRPTKRDRRAIAEWLE